MIKFLNMSEEEPYLIFKNKYESCIQSNQKNAEAMCVASYSNKKKEVSARYVNLKYIDNKEFIFFSNYNSPKASDFNSHNQISAVLYWCNIEVQISLKGSIKKTSKELNQKYFSDRSEKKNALAISSNQSKQIYSYSQVIENYNSSLKSDDLKKCPEYWGGFSFIPYYFEFWEGHESRINKREVFNKIDSIWKHSFLQP